MILQQNYDHIADDLRKAFRLYARRMLAYTVLDLVQRSKMHKQDKRVSAMCQREDNHESMNSFQSVGERSQFERSSEPESKKKTVKSIVFKESLEEVRESQIDISQLYYGDQVLIVRGGSDAIVDRIVLFNNQNSLSGMKFDDVRSNNINTKKCLFQIVQVNGLPRKPIIFGDVLALKNVWTGNYLSVQTDLIAHKCFGCRVVMKPTLEDDCHLRLGRVYDKLSQMNQNNLVHTNSQVRLVLSSNPFYKLLIQKQRRMCLEEKQEYQLVGSPSSQDLQLIKLNGDCNRSTNFLPSCQYFTIQNYQNLILSSIESRTNLSSREKTLVISIDGNQKTSFTYDNLSSDINQTELALIPIENERPPLRAIWEITKPKLLDPLNIYNDEEVILMNIVTREYLSLGSTYKKLKLTNEFSQSFLFKIEGQQGTFQLKMGNQSYTAPINRKNVRQDRPTLLNSPLGRTEVSPQVQNNLTCSIELIENGLFVHLKQFSDVLVQLLAIYEKVSIWGLSRNERGEIQYIYDRALEEEHLLKYELVYFQNNLCLILSYVSKANTVEFQLEDAQNFIRELGILEVLIYFCRLFMSKSQSNVKCDAAKTAFTVAKRHIQQTLLKTVDVIFQLIVDNRLSSDVLMQYASFFNVMLSSYPQEAGGLLHEAIRNLSILHTSYSDGQELFQWVKLVDHATSNNVSTQTKYLEILAEVLIDPKDKGILNYQNRCYQQLFSQRGRFKSKNKFVIFEVSNLQPYILLYGVKNSDNKDMEEVLSDQKESYCCISLEQLAGAAQKNPTAKKFIEYVRTTVKLFRNMCRDRNKKLRIEVQDLGLTRDYIIMVIQSAVIDHRTKMAFLDIYMEMYLDQDPFVPFNKAQKKCYIFDQLGRVDFRLKTSEIFKQYSETVDLARVKYEFDCFIKCYLICCLEDTSKTFMQHTRPSSDEFMLFSSLVKFLYGCANLGYFDIDFLCTSIGKVIEAAHCCLAIKEAQRKAHAPHMDKLLVQIFKLLDLLTSIEISIIILQNLAAIYRHYCETGEDYSQKQIMFRCQEMLEGSIRMRHPSVTEEQMSTLKNKKFPTAVQRLNSLQRRNYEKTIYPLQLLPEPTTTDNPFKKMYGQVNNFLLMVVMQHPPDNNGQAYLMCLNLLQRRNNLHTEYCSIMKNIEIIVDADDERIYQELAGGGPTQLLNINKLEQQTEKLTGEFAEVNGAEVRRAILLEISSLIKKLIKRLDIYELQSPLIFKKAQNIVSRLNVYNILRLIIGRCAGKQEFQQLLSTTYKFLTMFVRDNPQNSRQLAQDFEMFMSGLQYEAMPSLLSTIFEQLTHRQETFIMLLESSLTGTNRMIAFQTIFKIVKLWGSAKLHELAYNFILYQPQNKLYLSVQVQSTNVWFYRLLCHLIRIQPERGVCFREIYSRRELEKKVQLSPYATRSIYLQLLEVLYLSQIETHVELEFVVERLIVPVLRQAPRNLDGLTSHDYLKTFFTQDEGNLFEVERQQEMVAKAHEAADRLRAQFMNIIEEDKKMKKKQSQLDPLDVQVSYWHYVWQPTCQNYSLLAWIQQKLENNSLPHIVNMRVALLKLRQMLDKMITTTEQYTSIVKDIDYLLAFSEDGTRQPSNTIGATSLFFNKLCDSLIKSAMSLNQIFEIMGVQNHLVSNLMDVAVDREEFRLPIHLFIKRFRKIKKEIEKKWKTTDLNFDIFRKFLCSFDSYENIRLYFCQKVTEMMQQKKNSLLNTVYNDTKGQYVDIQSSNILLRSTTTKQFTIEVKNLNYVPSKFIKENMMARHLEEMCTCLEKYFSDYKLRQMKQDFQCMLDKKLHKDRREKMMSHFGKMLNRFNQHDIPLILALMFLQRISETQTTSRLEMTWELKLPTNTKNVKAHLIIKLSEKLISLFGYASLEKQQTELSNLITDTISTILCQLNTQLNNKAKFKIQSTVYDTTKLWKACPDSNLGNTIGSNLLMFTVQLLTNRQSTNFNKYHQISRCLLQFMQEARTFLNIFVENKQNQQLFQNMQVSLPLDLYAVDKQHMHNLKLFDLLLQLFIAHHTNGEAISYLDYTHFHKMLEYNYELYFKTRIVHIEQEIMCNHATCNELRCEQGKLKPYDEFIFGFICKIMIVIELASQYYREISNRQMLAFYEKFKGKIQINDGQSRFIYYKIPFLRSYRNQTIKNTVLELVSRHQKEELHKHIYPISQIMHEELKSWKMYSKFLPLFLLNHKQRFLHFLFILVFLMNWLVTVNIYSKRSNHPEATAMKAIIAILIVPQLTFTLIRLNTVRTVLKIDKSFSTADKLFLINWTQICSVVLQILALYNLGLYSIGCLMFALRIPAIQAIYRPAVREFKFFFRLFLYTLLFLISCAMLCSRKMGIARPIDMITDFFWEYVEVVFYDQEAPANGYFVNVTSVFPIRVICDILLKIAAALLIVGIVTDCWKLQRKKEAYEHYCLICLKQYQPEQANNHINSTHNLWNYLDYFVYLEEKRDLTVIETKVKKWIEDKNWNFLLLR